VHAKTNGFGGGLTKNPVVVVQGSPYEQFRSAVELPEGEDSTGRYELEAVAPKADPYRFGLQRSAWLFGVVVAHGRRYRKGFIKVHY